MFAWQPKRAVFSFDHPFQKASLLFVFLEKAARFSTVS
jgi:hypothetical protein